MVIINFTLKTTCLKEERCDSTGADLPGSCLMICKLTPVVRRRSSRQRIKLQQMARIADHLPNVKAHDADRPGSAKAVRLTSLFPFRLLNAAGPITWKGRSSEPSIICLCICTTLGSGPRDETCRSLVALANLLRTNARLLCKHREGRKTLQNLYTCRDF